MFILKKIKFNILLLSLFIALGVVFLSPKTVQAETCAGTLGEIVKMNPPGTCAINYNPGLYCVAKDEAECQALCKAKQTVGYTCDFQKIGNDKPASVVVSKGGQQPTSSLSDLLGLDNLVFKAFKGLLFVILQLFGWLLGMAGVLFAWVMDPSIMSGNTGLFNKQVVQDVWVMVRDLLNLLFISVLLVSAFSTVFQVSKYHISKVWFNVLLNALLVNFSFPIARLIIDLANVIMYYFLNNLFTGVAAKSGASILANISNFSALSSILTPQNYSDADVTYLIASIIFVFILGLTLFVLACLFVVRLIALTILIMFSPIGFVGYVFPGTSSFGKKWWDQLINYAFFGPIMTFIMAIALKIMETMKNDNMGQMIIQAKQNTVNMAHADWLGEAAFFTIPIMILWMGMGYANKMGIEGSKMVIGKAEKFANWAKGASVNWTGIPGGIKQAKAHYAKRGVRLPFTNSRILGSDQTESANRWVAGKLGVPNKYRDLVKDRADEIKASMDFDAMGKLKPDMRNAQFDRAHLDKKLAIASGLAEKGKLTPEMAAWLSKNHDSIPMAKEIFNKMKEKSPHMAFNNLGHIKGADEAETKKKIAEEQDKLATKFDMKTLDENIAKDTEFMALLTAKGRIGKKEIDGMDKSTKDAYTASMSTIIKDLDSASIDFDKNGANAETADKAKGAQLQHLALTGNLHESLDASNSDTADVALEKADARAQIWAKLNKDNVSKLSTDTIDVYGREIVKNLNRGKFGEIVKELSKNDGKKLVKALLAEDSSSMKMIAKDPYLQYLYRLT